MTFGLPSCPQLKQDREQERKDAIKNGSLADPDKPTSLAYAITPVGTCQDMCPEYERVERIVQLMVDGTEKISPSSDSDTMVPFEEIMVKRFRRSAAGYDEQLPSDIRPPAVLQRTLNYLINDVIGGPESLHKVHKFVWDRTRGIRNDFSIQQVTKVDDLRIAIDCFERIARFHILSLHQLSRTVDTGFDRHQEREQLNNTLLSLMYYYDDSRPKLTSPNEAEFRAYCIIFEIQDQRPDLEDRAQNWPRPILKDSRVQIALKLYAAAGNISDEQGPLRPRTQFLTAQANTGGFWNLVQSNAVSYMMACVAEIYFGLVRRTALQAISKAYRAKRLGQTRMDDWTLKDLTDALGFDDESKTRMYFRFNDVVVHKKEDGNEFIDVGSVMDDIDDDAWESHKFSIKLVESKRLGRTLPAVINGLSAAQAQSQGFIEVPSDADTASMANSESLFVGESDDDSTSSRSRSGSPQKAQDISGKAPQLKPTATPFDPKPATSTSPVNANPFSAATTFGRPSSIQIQSSSTPVFDFNSKPTNQAAHNPFQSKEPPKFNFLSPANTTKAEESKGTTGVFGSKETPKFNFAPLQSAPKTEGNSNGSVFSPFAAPMEKKPTFGQPSTTFTPAKSPEQTISVAKKPPTSTEVAVSPKSESVFDQPAASSAPPVFSFGTSPLFGSAGTEPKADDSKVIAVQTSPEKPPNTSTSQQKHATIKPPASRIPSTPKSTPSSLFPPSNATTEPTNVPPPAPLKIPTSNDTLLPTPESQFNLRSSQPSSAFSSSTAPTFQSSLSSPSTKSFEAVQKPTSVLEPAASNSRVFSSSTFVKPSGPQLNQEQSSSAPSQLDPKSVALDKLSRILLLEDNGIIQHFIEFTVGPIIKASIAHFDDEASWKEARECRAILLAKKFFKRWKANAWKMSLMRRAKQRRRNFASSIQNSAKKERQKQLDRKTSLSSLASSTGGSESPAGQQRNPKNMMPPPLTPLQKRQSLPADFDNEQSQLENPTGMKRKREDPGRSVDQGTPRRTKIYRQQSRTIGDSIMSAPPHPVTRTPYKSRMDVSKVKDGSLLSDILMKQARRLAPHARSDTTRTDYFQLKALGIDPDTPVVPSTKKRTRDEMEIDGTESSTGTILLSPRSTHSTRLSVSGSVTKAQPDSAKVSGSANDDDEELFAQIRSVREALAESEQWCRSERQSLEKSMTPQPESSPANNETPAQRRLREIKERGPTPSRTELRLRAMGDKALLPKGFWDGEGMGMSLAGKGKQKEVAKLLPPSRQREQVRAAPRGFAALERQGQMNGFTSGPFPPANNQVQQAAEAQRQAGSSAEDAIEL